MRNFELPLLAPSESPAEAFPRMAQARASGVVIHVGAQVRLLHFNAILDAFDQQVTELSLITAFEPVGLLDVTLPPEQCRLALEGARVRFGATRLGGIAELVSLHETNADVYLTAPSVLKCGDTPAHYYPPHRQNPTTPNVCVVDGTTLR